MSSNSIQSLSQKLAEKTKQDQELLESQTKNALQLHEQNLTQLSSDAQNIIKGAISEQMRQTLEETKKGFEALQKNQQTLISNQTKAIKSTLQGVQQEAEQLKKLTLKAWIRPLLITLSVVIGVMMGAWGTIAWLSNELMDKYQKLDEAYQKLELIQGIKVTRAEDKSELWIDIINPKIQIGGYKDNKDNHQVIFIEIPKTAEQAQKKGK